VEKAATAAVTISCAMGFIRFLYLGSRLMPPNVFS
jgi:hypothetical protein